MCAAGFLKTAVSPLATSTGRAALAGGALGAIMSASGKKKKPAAAPPPVLEPTAALGNSSNFNQRWYG